jgi:hypothetical protein
VEKRSDRGSRVRAADATGSVAEPVEGPVGANDGAGKSRDLVAGRGGDAEGPTPGLHDLLLALDVL